MTLQDIIEQLDLTVYTEPKGFAAIHPGSGYAADLLSCVMAGASSESIWVTLQAHINIVAVAALAEVCAVIISEGAVPEPDVIEKSQHPGHHTAWHQSDHLPGGRSPVGNGHPLAGSLAIQQSMGRNQ